MGFLFSKTNTEIKILSSTPQAAWKKVKVQVRRLLFVIVNLKAGGPTIE